MKEDYTTFYYPWKEKIKVVKRYSHEIKPEPSKLHNELLQNSKKKQTIQLNMAKILIGTPQEHNQMANKHQKKPSTASVIKEM